MIQNYTSPKNSKTFAKNLTDILCDVEFVKNGRKGKIANVPAVFDIEASSFTMGKKKQCCMYAFVFGINGRCVRGRTWGEFLNIIDEVVKFYNISLERRLIIYVHNLSYEFQWIKKYFEWENVFSIDTRKPIYAITKQGIEFRCSYILTNYSLAKVGEHLHKYKVEKMVGDLDYSLIRHSKTFLTDTEWNYILHDGLVVMAHIQEEIERLGNITKIPLTNTGYVRNLCREKCLKGENRFQYVRSLKYLTLNIDDYFQCKKAFAGGFTHGNIHHVGKRVKNVCSIDLTSAYPTVMCSEKFPMSKPRTAQVKSLEELKAYLYSYCCLFDVEFTNIRSRFKFESYISLSKCDFIEHYIPNNGRIIEAGTLRTTVTEQDFLIILKMYDWDDMKIRNFKYFQKDYLPKDFILSILDFYQQKTKLKGVEGKEVEYMVSKNMLNSCYGMCVTDPCREENLFEDYEWSVRKPDIETLLAKYNQNRNRFLYYPWGIWVTAYNRRNLFSAILEFGEDYVYSDTDSIKGTNYEKHKHYVEEYNKNIRKKIDKCLSARDIDIELSRPKTIKGVTKQLGVWDYEGEYKSFKTLGAKRYIVERDNGNLEITISGVTKSDGIEYLKYKYHTTDNIFKHFDEGLYFPPTYEKGGELFNGCGKLCHTYIDEYMTGEITDYRGVVSTYREESGVHMIPTDYTMSLDERFVNLLSGRVESFIV